MFLFNKLNIKCLIFMHFHLEEGIPKLPFPKNKSDNTKSNIQCEKLSICTNTPPDTFPKRIK